MTPRPRASDPSQKTLLSILATEKAAAQPTSLKAPWMRWSGKSAVPALYQTSVELVPNSQTSRLLTISETRPSGEPSALAKSSGSTCVPSSRLVTQIFWLFGSLNTK